MKVIVYNEGKHPLRVIVDNDKINDSQIEAGATSGTRCVQGELLNCKSLKSAVTNSDSRHAAL